MATKRKPEAQPESEKMPEAAPSPGQQNDEKTVESPISTTGAIPVFRTDMGESLPPQKPAGVE